MVASCENVRKEGAHGASGTRPGSAFLQSTSGHRQIAYVVTCGEASSVVSGKNGAQHVNLSSGTLAQ